MKKMLSLAAIATLSTSAFAFDYKISLEGRADFINRTTKTEIPGATTKDKSNDFESGLIRLSLLGKINDNLSYKLRYRLNNVPNTEGRQKSTDALDHLFIDHKNDYFTTRFGKTNWGEAYGRESYYAGTDLFHTSAAYKAYNADLGTYRYGVTAMHQFAGVHKIAVAISNPNKAATDTTGEKKNTSLAYAVHYSSSLADKMFQPLLSYTTAKQDRDTNSGTNTMMAAGFKSELNQLVIDADWKQYKAEKYNATVNDEKTTSIFTNVAYTIDSITPFVQYINDKSKHSRDAKGDYKKNSFAVGAMYKPFQDTNFRYHLAYSSATTKYDLAASGKVKDNAVIFGIKADL